MFPSRIIIVVGLRDLERDGEKRKEKIWEKKVRGEEERKLLPFLLSAEVCGEHISLFICIDNRKEVISAMTNCCFDLLYLFAVTIIYLFVWFFLFFSLIFLFFTLQITHSGKRMVLDKSLKLSSTIRMRDNAKKKKEETLSSFLHSLILGIQFFLLFLSS